MKQEIMMLISHIGHTHRMAVITMLEGQGISRGQPPILKYLSEHDGCIQRDLADNCHVKPATISSVLDNMEQSGYIQRRQVEGDRRAQRVFLTEGGIEKHNLVKNTFSLLDERILKSFSESEQNALWESLGKIMENLKSTLDERDVTDGRDKADFEISERRVHIRASRSAADGAGGCDGPHAAHADERDN